MKIVKYLSIAFLATSLIACGSDKVAEDAVNDIAANLEGALTETPEVESDGIYGDWKCTDMDMEMPDMGAMMDSASEQEKMMMDNMKVALDGMKTQMIEQGKMTINEDGTIAMTAVNMQGVPEKASGTWELTDDEKFFVVSTNGRSDSMNVFSLSDDEFVFGLDDPTTTFTISWGR